MNFGVKVEYIIKDVIDEPIKKSKGLRNINSGRNSKPSLMHKNNSPNHNNLISSSTKLKDIDVKANSVSPNRKNTSHTNQQEPMKLPSKLPTKRPTTAVSTSKLRIDPKSKLESDDITWDVNIHCDDRDLLIIEQDKIISKYNLEHPIFAINSIEPQLVHDRDVKKNKSVYVRDRYEHNSLRKVVNDPMPFYPFLHESSGIHSEKWNSDMTIRNEDEIIANEWSKPILSVNNSKSREAFQKQYRISPIKNEVSPVVYVEHSIDQSVISSYSKAIVMNTGIKMKSHK